MELIQWSARKKAIYQQFINTIILSIFFNKEQENLWKNWNWEKKIKWKNPILFLTSNFLRSGKKMDWHFLFFVFFMVVNICIRLKMANCGIKPCTTTFTHFFLFEPLLSICWTLKFSCFLKKVLFMRGNKKKVVFSLFFFGSKKSKKLQFSSHEIHFLVVFATKKTDTFDDIKSKIISILLFSEIISTNPIEL